MITLFNSNENNFNSNGIGILKEAYEVYINRKINSIYELEFKYPVSGKYLSNLAEFMCIKADGQLFRIKKISKTRLYWQILANHIFFDLNNNFLEDVAPTKLNGNAALNWVLNRTLYPHKFTAFSDIEVVNSARYVNKNVINAFIGAENSLVNRWGGEFDVDNFNIKFLKRIGKNKSILLSILKNISSVNVDLNIENLTTKLKPKGAGGITLPEKFVDSPLISNYPVVITREIEISDAKISDEMTEEQAYELMRETCRKQYQNGLDKPTINIKIDFIELSKTEEYKNFKNLETVYLGDTVSVFLGKYGINTSLRVISTKKNVLSGKYEKLELGDQINNLATSQLNTIKIVENLKNENQNLLTEAKDIATQLLTNALGGHVVKTRSEIFIMDTDDKLTSTKVWRWNLNGLGYSNHGIDGPYETAITQDGNIVANFVTAGTMSMDRIQGLSNIISEYNKNITAIQLSINGILEQVDTMIDYKRKVEGKNEIYLSNAAGDKILSLQINGNKTYESNLFPGINLFPSNLTQPNMRR